MSAATPRLNLDRGCRTIHELRTVLGDDVIKSTGADQLSISFDSFECDASQFNAHLASGALALNLGGSGVNFTIYEPNGEVETGTFATKEPSRAELELRERIKEGAW